MKVTSLSAAVGGVVRLLLAAQQFRFLFLWVCFQRSPSCWNPTERLERLTGTVIHPCGGHRYLVESASY